MYLFLESQEVLALAKVIAMVREGGGSLIYLEDGSVKKSVFRPETLARRSFLSKNMKCSLTERG